MIKLKIKYGNESTDIRFPCKETEMSAPLERIHAEDVTPLEIYVTEVIFPAELNFLQDRLVNLDEVNFLAKRMDGFFGDEEYQFYEAMKSEGFDTLPDLINLSFNLNRYPLIRDISDMGKIGREYLLTVKGCLPADDEDDPKYAEFGRKLIQSGKGVFTEHGLLFVDENTPFQKLYDGQVFPPYVYDSDVLCIVKAEYNGKSEYLYLPCEENAINSADTDLKKLWLVAEYAEVEEAGQLARLAENIDCFTVVEGAADYENVGRYIIDNNDCYALHPELEDYFDFNGFGEHIAEEYGGKFIDGNFIYNDTFTSLLDILYQDKPMTMGGMQI